MAAQTQVASIGALNHTMYVASFDLDLDEIAYPASGQSLALGCSKLSPSQRRKLTLEMDRRGFVVAKKSDEKTDEDVLLLTPSVSAPCDLACLDSQQLRYLSDLVGTPLTDPRSVASDLALLGFDSLTLLTHLHDEFTRYGTQNLVRRDRIVEHEMVEQLTTDLADLVLPSSQVPAGFARKRDLFLGPNAGKCFISVDLRAAVYHCFRTLAPNSTLGQSSSWSAYVGGFTSSRTLSLNKALRLRVFGKAKGGSRVETLWQNRLYEVFQQLAAVWPDVELFSFGNDEFLIETSEHQLPEQAQAFALLDTGTVKVRAFRLHALNDPDRRPKKNKKQPVFFVRQDLDVQTGRPTGKFDVKGIEAPRRIRALRLAQEYLETDPPTVRLPED